MANSSGHKTRAHELIFPRGSFSSTLLMELPLREITQAPNEANPPLPAGWPERRNVTSPLCASFFLSVNKSSFLRVFRGLVEIMFVTYGGQGLSYINRGYYYIWWLIANYKLYKGGSKSRCSLLSLMQIKKTTPREEHISPVSFFLFLLRL